MFCARLPKPIRAKPTPITSSSNLSKPPKVRVSASSARSALWPPLPSARTYPSRSVKNPDGHQYALDDDQLGFFAGLLPGHSSEPEDRIRQWAVLAIGRLGGDHGVDLLSSFLNGTS